LEEPKVVHLEAGELPAAHELGPAEEKPLKKVIAQCFRLFEPLQGLDVVREQLRRSGGELGGQSSLLFRSGRREVMTSSLKAPSLPGIPSSPSARARRSRS